MHRLAHVARLLFAVGAAALIARTTIAAGELDGSLALLDALEARRATVELRDVPLDEAVSTIEAAAGVAIRVDWESLKSLGVGRDDRVTLHFADQPVYAILQSLTLSIGRDYERPVFDVGGGQVVITTTAGAGPLRVSELYDVRALLADGKVQGVLSREIEARDQRRAEADEHAQQEAHNAAAGGTPAAPVETASPERFVVGDDADDAADAAAAAPPTPPPAPPSAAARLGELLMQHVDPESWFVTSGGGVRIDEHDGVLVVTAPPRVHRQLRALVDRLLAAHPTAAMIETVIVRIDRTRLDLLRRRHAPGSAAMGRALVTGSETTVLWRSAVLTRLGETATVETETAAVAGTQAREHVTLSVKPRLDGATSTMSVATDVRFEREGRVRRATATAALPLRDGAALIEFAGENEPEATVVVVMATAT